MLETVIIFALLKRPASLTLVCGIFSCSAADLKALAHKQDRTDVSHLGFPDMNHSVYVEQKLRPIRSRDHLTLVLQIKGITPTNVDSIFANSGGIGRFLGFRRKLGALFVRDMLSVLRTQWRVAENLA